MSKIFVDLKENGELNGFYTEGLHKKIPETAVEISKETRDLIIAQHKRFKLIDLEKAITLDNLEEVEMEKIERPITPLEKVRADVDYIAIMTGVDLDV